MCFGQSGGQWKAVSFHCFAQFQLACWSHISSGDWCVCVCVFAVCIAHCRVDLPYWQTSLTFLPVDGCYFQPEVSICFLLKCCHLSCNVKQHVMPYIADQEKMVEGKISPDVSAVVLDYYNLFVRKGTKHYD